MDLVRYSSAAGRWVLLATVLGSSLAFIDSTVVNIALPAIARDLDSDAAGLLAVAFAGLVIRALTLDGALDGLDAFFTPDWSALTDSGQPTT